MNRRLLAFISSGMQELAPERGIVKSELDKLQVDAWVFEKDAGARPQTIRQTYFKEIESADLYVGIFWKRYGEYTIEEFRHAYALGKSCLVYEKRLTLDDRDPRLTEFLEEIGDVKTGLLTIRWFETPEQLGEFVKQDVAAWQTEIVRNAPPRGYPAPFQAPALTDQYVERPSVKNTLSKTLLTVKENGLRVVTRAALHGIGGTGKSVAAAAFAGLDAVLQSFPDGVLWVTLGQNPDLTQRISDWGRALHDPEVGAAGYADPVAGMNQLRALLRERACLLVVDDVWQTDHVRPFVVGGRRCLLLITTRIKEIAEALGAMAIELGEMTSEEALSLVQNWTGKVEDHDREKAERAMREVQYLPLALELVGAQVKKLGWDEYSRTWERQKLRAIKRGRRSLGKQDNLWDSIELSVAALPADDRRKYFSLGVFPEDTAFPPNACAVLWGCTEDEAQEILIDFAGQALLQQRSEPSRRRFVLHDLFYEYLVDQLGPEQRAQAVRTLVDGYRKLCAGVWQSGPDDGYFFEHLAQHLATAGLVDDLYRLTDRPWMEAQFRRAYSHLAFSSDVATAIETAKAERPPNLLQIIRLSFIRATLGSLATRSDPEALAALARIGQAERALGHGELIQEPAKRSEAYRLIAQALLAQGKVLETRSVLQDAMLAARNVERKRERCIALCSLVEPLIDSDEVELARNVAADAEAAARAENHPYFIPDLLIRSAHAYALVGNTEQCNLLGEAALATVELEEYQDRKLAFLVQLETIFRKTGNSERANEIEDEESTIFEEINNAVRDGEDIYLGYGSELSDAYFNAGDLEGAAVIAERWVGQRWQQAGALGRAGSALAVAGTNDRAVQVAEQAATIVRELLTEKQYSFELNERIESLGCVAEALVRISRDEEAAELVALAPDIEAKIHAFGSMALALAHNGQVEGARRAAEASLAASHRLPDTGANETLWLAAVCKGLKAAGNTLEASKVAMRALKLSGCLRVDDWRHADAIMVLVRTLTELGEREKARVLVERLDMDTKKAEALVNLIGAYGNSREQARGIANNVAQIVQDVKDASKAEVLGKAANALVDAGLKTEAVKLARLAVAATLEIEDLNRGPTDGLSEAAQALARVGLFHESRTAADKISAHQNENPARVISKRVRALGVLAEAFEDGGQHELAVATAHDALDSAREALTVEADEYSFRSEALILAAKALTRVGEIDNGENTNRQALELALTRLKELGG